MSAPNYAFKYIHKHADELPLKAITCTFLVFSRVTYNEDISLHGPENNWQIILTLYPEALTVKLITQTQRNWETRPIELLDVKHCVVRPVLLGTQEPG